MTFLSIEHFSLITDMTVVYYLQKRTPVQLTGSFHISPIPAEQMHFQKVLNSNLDAIILVDRYIHTRF